MAFLSSLRRRQRVDEMMDDPNLDPAEHRRALAGLARLNRFSGSVSVLWKPLAEFARRQGRTIRVLDVATGSGDVPIGLSRRARDAGLPLAIEGCDISDTALATAKLAAAEAAVDVKFFHHDAVRDPLPLGFDVVTCSLFLHHLSSDDALSLVRRMAEAARSLVLINDLSRSRFNYLAVGLACHVLSRSPVVRFDGPASVRSAFSPAEAKELAHQAGLSDASVQTRFPCRFLLQWKKP
jgi:2-polyprenyl-3-methyl-5-hydroxy-6-metoxy-1,4-benzoquinol methylase